MKHIIKIMSLLVSVSAFWISLLLTSIIPESYTLLILKWSTFLYQLPIYLIVSLGCYGLLLVGIGLMRFPTCPYESVLLQQDIVEAKEFLKENKVDVGSD
ncbi:hypothetical protein ACJIZ3_019071 [Penstemon smallii]|uniref:Dolichol-phosphate mannosyltransferase subunit 3 n=1 Tax=Penstemon smallii TaxID=265156 RepID=A0ABD3T065_9LAMI